MGLEHLSGCGDWNGASFRFRIMEWGIDQDSDNGMEHLLGFGFWN